MKKTSRKPARRVAKKKGAAVIAIVNGDKKKRNVKFPGGENRERTQEEIWFSTNLKTVRDRWGWGQEAMAALFGMRQSSYSNIEHHRRSLKMNTVSFICNKVHIPVHKMVVDPETFATFNIIPAPPKRPS